MSGRATLNAVKSLAMMSTARPIATIASHVDRVTVRRTTTPRGRVHGHRPRTPDEPPRTCPKFLGPCRQSCTAAIAAAASASFSWWVAVKVTELSRQPSGVRTATSS